MDGWIIEEERRAAARRAVANRRSDKTNKWRQKRQGERASERGQFSRQRCLVLAARGNGTLAVVAVVKARPTANIEGARRENIPAQDPAYVNLILKPGITIFTSTRQKSGRLPITRGHWRGGPTRTFSWCRAPRAAGAGAKREGDHPNFFFPSLPRRLKEAQKTQLGRR